MVHSTTFFRILFLILSLLFMMSYFVGSQTAPLPGDYVMGAVLGLGAGGLLIVMDNLLKRFHLRFFNIAVLGLFIGYLMSRGLILILDAIIEFSQMDPNQNTLEIAKIVILLVGTYTGVIMTLRSSNELSLCIPFVKLTPTAEKARHIIMDLSALSDPRIIDLAASGLLDKQLILPRFLLKELFEEEENPEESTSQRAKRTLDVVRKLESFPELSLRYQDTDFPDAKDPTEKVLRLARLLGASVLSADINRVQMVQVEGIRIINIHTLSNALKPLMQRGERMKIKIQRHGKEDLQGIGYLEDGTMVVVNGGGSYIGELINAIVLSVKPTSSGRMIFCNVAEGEECHDAYAR